LNGRSMSLRNKLAAVCIALPTLAQLAAGVIYFRAPEIMPYHKEVLGVGWSQVQPGVRTMLVAFVNVYGAMQFAVAIALAVLLLVPMRRGQPWARWGILAVGFPTPSSKSTSAISATCHGVSAPVAKAKRVATYAVEPKARCSQSPNRSSNHQIESAADSGVSVTGELLRQRRQ